MSEKDIPTIISRKQAIELGLNHYFTGIPCRNGHISKRRISRCCLACMKIHSQSYRNKNPMAARTYTAEYRLKNPTYQRRYEKERWVKYKNYLSIKRQLWQKKNKIKTCIYASKRRAYLRNASGNFSVDDVKSIGISQKWKCINCKKDISLCHSIDHIMPLALGGDNSRRNIQLLCRRCNSSKNKKHPIDWAQENGRLL